MSETFISDTKKQFGLIFTICFAGFMILLDSSIVNISLPEISRYFNITMSKTAMISLSYLLVLTSTLIVAGKIADKIGLKKFFIIGYILFTSASFLCGVSNSFLMLVVSRAFQGLGAAIMYVVTTAIIPKYLPINVRGKAFSVLLMACTLGLILGAPLGGIITTYFSWHWIFLINIPFGAAACYVAQRLIPPDEENADVAKKRFDIAGAVLSFFGLSFFCFVVNQGEEIGWLSPIIISILILAVIFAASFIYRQKSTEFPLVDLKIFENRNFVFANMTNIFYFAAFAGNNFMMPFFLTKFKGYKTNEAGFIVLLFSIAFMIVNYFVGCIVDKMSRRKFCAIGALAAVLAYLVFVAAIKFSGLWSVLLFLLLAGIAMGIFSAPINELVMNMAKEGEQGVVSGIFKTGTNLGLILGVCIFELVFEQAIVHRAAIHNMSIFDANIPSSILFSGFRFVYISGVLINVMALVFSISVKDDSKNKTIGGLI